MLIDCHLTPSVTLTSHVFFMTVVIFVSFKYLSTEAIVNY